MRLPLTTAALIAASLTLAACGQADNTAAKPAAPVAETAEQAVARIAASLGPQDFKLREIQCLGALSLAKMDKDELPPELGAEVEAMPRMDFLALVRQARELGLTHEQINTKQHDQMARLSKPEDITPEYETNVRECLQIAKVANARDGVTQ